MNYTEEIYKSLVVLSEMFNDRGLDYSNLNRISQVEIATLARSRNIFSIDADNVLIVYDMSPKLKWVDTKKYIDGIFTKELYNLVIIVVKDITELRKIKELINIDHQDFSLQELQFNISKHSLVPKHELITSEEEIAKILKNYQLRSPMQLPLILKSDPMSKYLNARIGNVIKVYRVSRTSGENIVYRYVT